MLDDIVKKVDKIMLSKL